MDSKWKNSLCFVEFSYFLFLSRLQPYFLLEEEPRQVSTFFVLPVKCYPCYIRKNEMEPAGLLENKNFLKSFVVNVLVTEEEQSYDRRYED